MIESTKTAAETQEACAEFFREVLAHESNSILILRGEPGAGKTTFCRGFASAMEISDNINSPTFNLHNRYEGRKGILHHYDLYRLSAGAELEELGFLDEWSRGEHLPTVHAIEWGEKALPALDPNLPVYMVDLAVDERDDSQRMLRFYRRNGDQFLPLH